MTDILLDTDNSLLFDAGDFVVGASEAQHVRLILDINKGDWTQSPLIGVGLTKYLKGNLDARLEREIRLQLTADGINANVEIGGGEVFIYT